MSDELKINPPSVKPRYLLLKPFYVNDNYINEGVEIEFTGTPNEQMQPLNPAAEAKMAEFLKSNGGFTPRIEDITYARMLERPKEITMPSKQEVPMMGNLAQKADEHVAVVKEVKPLPQKKMMGTVIKEESNHGAASI